jgi:hypothetical protein
MTKCTYFETDRDREREIEIEERKVYCTDTTPMRERVYLVPPISCLVVILCG